MNYCDTCNAGYDNKPARLIRCGTCSARPDGAPTKYISTQRPKEIDADRALDAAMKGGE